jgi:predicted RNase H-like nuclease (RuvC/YqgF family)
MSRRASNAGGGGVSLFPFLSILACLIGILTLLIKLISDVKEQEHRQRDKGELARAERMVSIQSKLKKLQQESASVKKTLAQRNAASVELDELEDKRIVLRKKLAEIDSKAPKDGDLAMQKELERLIEQIANLKKERPALEKQLAELRAELERRKIKPSDKPPPVVIQPGGSGLYRNAKVFFVECDANGITLLELNGKKTPVSLATIATDRNYAAMLNQVKSQSNGYVLFLIRSSGQNAWRAAAALAESQYAVVTGKLPVPSNGEIDLGRFK